MGQSARVLSPLIFSPLTIISVSESETQQGHCTDVSRYGENVHSFIQLALLLMRCVTLGDLFDLSDTLSSENNNIYACMVVRWIKQEETYKVQST